MWPRAILLIDMNAFFASVEQSDRPEWQGLPIAITNGDQGTCIITSSYEARRFGIKTGMRLPEAKRLCPDLIICGSHPKRYAEVSTQIMTLLRGFVPDMEVFSVDEAFLDVTAYQNLYGSPPAIARMLKQAIFEQTHIPCSVGVSGDKTTAKFAAKQNKPDGFTVIPPWEAKARLANVPVTELCGIANGIGRFLQRYGVYYCGDMERLPIGILAKRFGNLGRRLWHMCQGADPAPLAIDLKAPKSMGHGKVMPPKTTDRDTILIYFMHMAEKLAARLRRNNYDAQHFYIGLRIDQYGFISTKAKAMIPTQDGKQIYQLAVDWFERTWHGQATNQVQITALDPRTASQQQDLLQACDPKRDALHSAIDQINQCYGEFSVAPARLLRRTKMNNVIAPGWRPDGHRQSIP